MAKEKNRDLDNSTVNDGSHAIHRFTIGDFLIILVLVILCLTCILPFIHLAAKSISSNTAVMQRAVVLWPIGTNFDASPAAPAASVAPQGFTVERVHADEASIFTRLAIDGDCIYFGNSLGQVKALDKTTHQVRW